MFKIVSTIRKYHNQNLQTNPWHYEEEPHNNHEIPGGQTKQLSPLVKYFTDPSKAVLLLCIFYAFSVLCLLYLCTRLFICALGSPDGKGLTSWLSFVVFNCEFVNFPLVSWIRYGT